MSTWKTVSNSDPGAGNVYGGDDVDNLFKMLNDTDVNKTVKIKNTPGFGFDTFVDFFNRASAPSNPGVTSVTRFYTLALDANNNAFYALIRENNGYVTVRIL